jgi:hypothetical protein
MKTQNITKKILNASKVMDDILYYCFDDIQETDRVKVSEVISELKKLAIEIEQAEDAFFNS